MTSYEITSGKFRKIDETSFSSAGLRERQDMQRLLRSQIEIVSPDMLVIAEELSQWEDSNRRLDLLGVDKNAILVVTEDGGKSFDGRRNFCADGELIVHDGKTYAFAN